MSNDELSVEFAYQRRQKQARRQDLANLPIEEKVKILVKLQQMSADVKHTSGRSSQKPWKISKND